MWYTAADTIGSTQIAYAAARFDTSLITRIDDWSQSGPLNYVLHQNYPNPFNPSTIIEFDLPKASEVILRVFNILGEEVTTLVSDRLSAGSYSYGWSRPAGIASGIYLYRLQADDPSHSAGQGYVETKKMILMK
jgi:hypothetical protein